MNSGNEQMEKNSKVKLVDNQSYNYTNRMYVCIWVHSFEKKSLQTKL